MRSRDFTGINLYQKKKKKVKRVWVWHHSHLITKERYYQLL